MDPLSHVLLGASLGYTAFARKIGRTGAWVGGLAAFIPDADIFIRSKTDPLLAIEYHRHFTHALLFAPIGAALVAAIALLRPGHRPQALALWGCATFAYLSHCFLDAATSYGTQLLWPFSNQRFGGDVISIIDPIFTLTLAIALTWSLINQRRRPAVVGLIFGLGYLALGVTQHARAAAAQAALAHARGHAREHFEVMPTMGNNLVWRALYIHRGRIHSDRIRVGWFASPTARSGWSLPVVRPGDLRPAEAARNQHRSFERFAWFSDGWVGRSPNDESVLGDMRYSLSAEAFDPIWGIRFTASTAPVEIAWVNRTRDRKVNPAELWHEIIGRDPRFLPLDDVR